VQYCNPFQNARATNKGDYRPISPILPLKIGCKKLIIIHIHIIVIIIIDKECLYHSSHLTSSDPISTDLISSEPGALWLVAATVNWVVCCKATQLAAAAHSVQITVVPYVRTENKMRQNRLCAFFFTVTIVLVRSEQLRFRWNKISWDKVRSGEVRWMIRTLHYIANEGYDVSRKVHRRNLVTVVIARAY